MLAAYGVGSAAGALLVSSLRLPRRYLTVMLLCWGLGSLPLAAFGLADGALADGRSRASRSASPTPPRMVIWGTLLQRRVPPHLLGRVSSLDFFVSLALLPLSMALAGPVGERIGIPTTFVVAAWSPPLLAVVALVGLATAPRRARPPAGPHRAGATRGPATIAAAP